jgi:hypothetical protein
MKENDDNEKNMFMCCKKHTSFIHDLYGESTNKTGGRV